MDEITTVLVISGIFSALNWALIKLGTHPLVAFLASGGLILTVAAVAEAL